MNTTAALEPDNSAAKNTQNTQNTTVFSVLIGISFSHFLNDSIQSLIPSIYPLLKDSFALSFAQVGLIQLTFQMTASILQPFVGAFTDKRPQPYSLALGMCFTLLGLIAVSYATTFVGILLSVALIGTGSSIFHPESSKIAFMASGGRRGLAQSIFQVGGNAGSAIGPILAAAVIVTYGRQHAVYFAVFALLAITILYFVGRWAKAELVSAKKQNKHYTGNEYNPHLSRRVIYFSVGVLLVLMFSKFFYLASISSYYTFFLIQKFGVSMQVSQIFLFAFLAASALGTYFGGPLGDRYGRKYIIWFSILGAAPFTLLMPYVGLTFTAVLSVVIGFILSSAFPAILVYAQELMPGKVGMISGFFFGFAFGMGGLGAALLGVLADHTSIHFVYTVCAFLPLIGFVTWFLPNLTHGKD